MNMQFINKLQLHHKMYALLGLVVFGSLIILLSYSVTSYLRNKAEKNIT